MNLLTNTQKIRKSGFSLLELTVVTVLITLAFFGILPAINSAVVRANISPVSVRGRDIYVAITCANTEREPLGLPPVWPADPGFYTNAVQGDITAVNFTNSTDFFWSLIDGDNLGTEKWSPYVAGFNFSKLAGAGVPQWKSGRLEPENNMWSIAKNIDENTPDVIPFLITRNVDASSLATKITEGNDLTRLRFDPDWRTLDSLATTCCCNYDCPYCPPAWIYLFGKSNGILDNDRCSSCNRGNIGIHRQTYVEVVLNNAFATHYAIPTPGS
ncbi:MAG: hypothetical protein PF904_05835 [Kiritimatiellae bacterium]|nr:hypothetical protein [Kiritimatiellia bacterium]